MAGPELTFWSSSGLSIGPPIFAVVSVALAWVAVTRLARRS